MNFNEDLFQSLSLALAKTDTTSVGGLIFATVVTLTMFMWKRNRKPLPPGPYQWPLVGNIPQMAGDEKLYVKLNKFKSYGDIVYLTLGSMKMLVLYGHDMVNKVLTDRADDFKFRPDWLVEIQTLKLYQGMVWSNDELNVRRRHFAAPALYPGVGSLTVEGRVQQEARAIVQELQRHGGSSLPLRDIFTNAVFNINSSAVFGSRYEYTDEEFLQLTAMIKALLQSGGTNNPKNFFRFLQAILPTSSATRKTMATLKQFHEFIHKQVEVSRKTYDENNIRSLVDLFIKNSGEDISEENLVHTVRDLFVAGSENVAFALLWLVAYMIKYPKVQQRCRQVLKDAGLQEGTAVGMDDVSRLVYVQATVNEVLRVVNIAPMSVPHATIKEVEFEGYAIPKDTMVLTHLVSVHNDPKYWENPETFNPDRFIGENGQLLSKEAFYPYSLGPRYCVAQKMAEMDLFIVFSECLRHFEFRTPEGSQPPTLKGRQPGAFIEPEAFDVCVVADS